MGVKELSDKGPDGTRLGQTSTDLVGFYGATPVVRYATSVVAPASTASVSVSATQWGFSTSTQANALISAVARLTAAINTIGLTTST
jgi:UDP-N-acetyl-D-mannosaminuronic acid transferase (WecB/TagA/CpsF family)